MIQITKVSSKKYEVFESGDETPIYTIKRVSSNRYIIRGCPPSKTRTSAGGQGGWNPPDMIIMNSLKEAKDFVRAEKTEEDVNWLAFFVRHTKGKKFESKEESNKHMSMLSKRWKESKICPSPEGKKHYFICSLKNGCFCEKQVSRDDW
jgi:hypothetical protein